MGMMASDTSQVAVRKWGRIKFLVTKKAGGQIWVHDKALEPFVSANCLEVRPASGETIPRPWQIHVKSIGGYYHGKPF